ncbi:MAG: hypothetical protein AAGI23_21450 [Bacteroidota bacterium]
MKILLVLSFFVSSFAMMAQTTTSDLPYHQIPETPESYTANAVAARMIDGLGFRYYWATEGLRDEDLSYQPGEHTRNIKETLNHIYDLCEMILNATKQVPNIRPRKDLIMGFEEQRAATLLMLKEASDLLREQDKVELSEAEIVFKRGDRESTFPFWNVLNGPLADAIWHVGQVVSFRRSSGNPTDGRVDVFSGKLRN